MDVLWLDIQYTDAKKYFTWDPVHYGDPNSLIASISADDRKLVTIIDPHVKVDDTYSVFRNLIERDFFVKCNRKLLSILTLLCLFPLVL